MKKYTALIIILLLCRSVLGIVYGSDAVVSRQSVVTFPAPDVDNEMRGFGVFESGFTLANNTTTCLFNSFFPVSGIVNFNGGTLDLNLDLLFHNSVDIASAGTISGSGYSVGIEIAKSF